MTIKPFSNSNIDYEEFNLARHGGTVEDMRAQARNARVFFFVGVLVIALAFVFFILFFVRSSGSSGGRFLFWFSLVVGFGMLFIGINGLVDVANFNARAKFLKDARNGGLVTRGSILSVRSGNTVFGRTTRTNEGDSGAGAVTGYFYRVRYVFNDNNGRERRETAIIPDPLGPKRRNTTNHSAIDPHRPRVGQRVDVLFDHSDSIALRIIDAV